MSTKKRDAMEGRIIAAALRVLEREGMLGLTQPRVAKAAGLRQSHLTYYFPTRSALVEAVAGRVAKNLIARFDTAFAAASPAALAAGLTRLGIPEQTRLLLAMVLAADREKSVRGQFRTLTKAVRARIAAGLSAHGMVADADSVAMFHALCVGLAVLDLARGEKESRRELRNVTRFALARVGRSG